MTMQSKQNNNRGSNAPSSFATASDLEALLSGGAATPTPKTATNPAPKPAAPSKIATASDLEALLSGQATTPAPVTQSTSVEPSKPVAEPSKPVTEPKKSWWESANERLSAPKALSSQRGRGFVAEENKADQAKAAAPLAPDAVTFESLYKDDDKFKIVNDMMSVIGKGWDGKQPKEDVVKDFTRYWRSIGNANSPTLAGLANRVSNTNAADRQKLGKGFELASSVPSFWRRGAEPGLSKVWHTISDTIFDPGSYIGLGAGAVAKQLVGRTAAKEAVKRSLTPALVAGATDAGVAAAIDFEQQKTEHQLKDAAAGTETPFKLDKFQTAVSALLSGGLTAAGTKQVSNLARPPGSSLKKKLDAIPDPVAETEIKTEAKKEVVDGVVTQMDEEVRKYVKANGEAILGAIGPESVVADAKIRTKLSEAAVDVAVNVIKNDPTFAPKEGQLVSDAINRVFASLETDEITDAALESAIRQAGLTPEQFAAANSASITEAARLMQQYSTVAKMMNRLRTIDPDFNKEMENLYKGFEMRPSHVNQAYSLVKSGLHASKGVMVSGVDTTMRNVMAATENLTIGTTAKLMEGTAYTIGQATYSLMRGKVGEAVSEFGPNMAKTLEDTFKGLYYLANKGLANDLSDLLTMDNPAIRARMMGSQEDVRGIASSGVDKVVGMLNVLNSIQDSFFRRAAFAESVDRQLSDVGLDLMTILKENGTIPKDVISRASDDALKATMSYTPRITAGGNVLNPVTGKMEPKINTIDVKAERLAGLFVNKAEDSVIANVLVPFPRFMANALAWTYRHSPFGVVSITGDIRTARAAAEAGDEASRIAAVRKAYNNGARALMGTTAFLAAIKYRQDNQDVEPTVVRNDDGSVTDVSTMWPIPQYLALADVFVKWDKGLEADAKKATEVLLGMKVPAGAQATFIDTILEMSDSEDKMQDLLKGGTKMVGDLFGRVTQPFVTKQVFDVADMLNEDTAARDPNVVKDPDSLTELAVNRVRNRLGPLKYDLDKAVPKGGDINTIERRGEVLHRIIGVRFTYEGSELQRTMNELGLKPYKVLGKTTGDKAIDNKIAMRLNEIVPERVKMLERDWSDTQYPTERGALGKKVFGTDKRISRQIESDSVKNMIMGVAAETTKIILDKEVTDVKKRAKMYYQALPAARRRAIRQVYESKYNKPLEEVDAYEKAEELNALIDAQTFKYNTGGFVQRRQ
jgi:hypothetical protein